MMNNLDPKSVHGLSRDIAIFLAERDTEFPAAIIALAHLLCTICVEIGAPKEMVMESLGKTYDIIQDKTRETMQ